MSYEDEESKALHQSINAAVVKGLRSKARVEVTAKITISAQLYAFLKSKYALRYTLLACDALLDDFRVIRANFFNERDYARAVAFEFAIRNSRPVSYSSFKKGKLVHRSFTPNPYFVIRFSRDPQILGK
jgi:hypothetical protein